MNEPKIEDIFSGVDKSAVDNKSADMVNPAINNVAPPMFSAPKKDHTKMIATIAIVVLIVVVIAVLGIFLVKSGILAGDKTPANVTGNEVVVPNENKIVETPKNNNQVVDSDHDGLSDEEETAYNTNQSKADTDADGLFDGEEVRTYKTDPLRSDTDGDGHLDGVEVAGGYNPLGAGKLLNFEEARKALNNK